MFYEERDILECLKCPKCGQRFDDPYLLPCGETICGFCLLFLIQNKNVRCFFCSRVHDVPRDGFPKSKLALKLMQQHSKEIYRSKSVHELKQNLALIKEISQKLDFNLNNAIDKIKEHCDNLRNKIQIDTECAILAINKLNEKMIDELAKYEKECIMTFENDENSIDYFKGICVRVNSFCEKWDFYLSQSVIDEKEIDDALKTSVDLRDSLKRDCDCLIEVIFNGNVTEYKSNLQFSSSFGHIVSNEAKSFLSFTKFEKLEFKLNLVEVSVLTLLENGNFFLAYPETSTSTVLLIYDSTGSNLLSKKLEKFQFAFFACCTFSNSIVYSAFSNENRDFIRVVDESLEVKSKLEQMFVNGVMRIDADENGIVCQVSDRNKKKYMAMYSWQLHLIKTIQTLPDVLVNNEVKWLKLCDDLIVVVCSDNEGSDLVSVLRRNNNAELIKSFKIPTADLKVFCDYAIVVYDYKSAKILFFDLDGKILFEFYLVSFPSEPLSLLAANKFGAVFYHEKKSTVYRKSQLGKICEIV